MDIKRAVLDLIPSRLIRVFAAPYVAGRGLESGIRKAHELHQGQGLATTLDLLGEEVIRPEDVKATVDLYFRMIEASAGHPHITLSMKPTQLGILQSEAACQENLRAIVAEAARKGVQVTLDMEDRTLTDVTLRMFKAIRDEFDNLGIVLQSRLFRTPEDIRDLHARPCRVRICIGIYKEPADVALQDKPAMKEKLLECVELLVRHGHYPEIATHDEPLIRRCIQVLDAAGVPRDGYEFQMLLGVPRTAIQQEIVKRGQVMRLYVPFAEEWEYATRYLRRRLGANPFMAGMVLKNMLGR
ncbi:MAG TPA: proline dehydrogenase family protein [Holophaga sp.]|nr:proline dehydrogenase family protein [Holophaga sp.]